MPDPATDKLRQAIQRYKKIVEEAKKTAQEIAWEKAEEEERRKRELERIVERYRSS